MTPEPNDLPPETPPPAAGPPASDWGDDPPPFTAEEIEDIRKNGLNLSDVIASILTDLKLR